MGTWRQRQAKPELRSSVVGKPVASGFPCRNANKKLNVFDVSLGKCKGFLVFLIFLLHLFMFGLNGMLFNPIGLMSTGKG